MPVPEQWTRPRVGQHVRLVTGAVGEVILVRKAREVLKTLSEDKAMVLSSYAKSCYGQGWLDIYYEADIIVNGTMVTISPRQVAAVLDAA